MNSWYIPLANIRTFCRIDARVKSDRIAYSSTDVPLISAESIYFVSNRSCDIISLYELLVYSACVCCISSFYTLTVSETNRAEYSQGYSWVKAQLDFKIRQKYLDLVSTMNIRTFCRIDARVKSDRIAYSSTDVPKLKEKYGKDVALTNFRKPKHFLEAQGIRRDFIIKTCFNPCSFSTWFYLCLDKRRQK